jgi:hypothetical protein
LATIFLELGYQIIGRRFRAMASDKPRSIVTYVHRPKRPPRKKAQAAAITGPVIVLAGWTNARSDV